MIIEYVLSRRGLKTELLSRKAKGQLRDCSGRFTTQAKTALEAKPLMEFDYPSSQFPHWNMERNVRVISFNETYLIGLEQNVETDKWQFKKFRRDKMTNLRYNALALE